LNLKTEEFDCVYSYCGRMHEFVFLNYLFLFVSFFSWNIRYDEWITRSRIAQNLTWTPNRKRVPIPIARSDWANRRGRSSLGRSPQPSSRSGTPSSITSSISCQSTVEKPRKDESPKIKDDRKDETGSGKSVFPAFFLKISERTENLLSIRKVCNTCQNAVVQYLNIC